MKKAQQRLYVLRQLRMFNPPQELLIQFYSAIIESVLCTSITVWFSSATKSDLRRLRRVVRTAERIIGTTPPLSRNCTHPDWAKGLTKSLWTPHTQHTPSLNCYRLVDATELWAPERPDTETVSFPKQSSHEHLTLNMEHTTLLYNYLFITHTYFFSFQICTCQTSHIIVCIVYCVFDILYIVHLLLSVSCCCHSVAPWRICDYNKFLVCVNIPGQ